MHVEESGLRDVRVLRPGRIADMRGYSQESWNADALSSLGVSASFVEEVQVYSRREGTLFGLSCPSQQIGQQRLVRAVSGEILQVAVDARKGSPSYGTWCAAVLSAANGKQMHIAEGFLHGYVTRVPDTTVLTKLSVSLGAVPEAFIHFADPLLAIDWTMPRDRILPNYAVSPAMQFASWDSPFEVREVAA